MASAGVYGPRLVVCLETPWPDAGRDDQKARARFLAYRGRLLGGGDYAVEACVLGERRPPPHELGRRLVDALLHEIGRPEIGKHGDAEQLHPARPAPANRRFKRLAVHRMHGEEMRAGPGDGGCRPLYRRLDVEKLGVNEDSGALCNKVACELKPT